MGREHPVVPRSPRSEVPPCLPMGPGPLECSTAVAQPCWDGSPLTALLCLDESILQGHCWRDTGRTPARCSVTGMLCAHRTALAVAVPVAVRLPGMRSVSVGAGVMSCWETWCWGRCMGVGSLLGGVCM